MTDITATTTATYDTDEWGRPTGGSGSSSQPFGFTGEPQDATGLVYLRTRYYSPDLGRFLTRDNWPGLPAVPQTHNRYTYVTNNPTSASDPSGRFLDALADAAFIVYDIGALVFGPEKERASNWLALGADVVGAFLPFVTGGGLAVRAGMHAADHVDDAIGGIRFIEDGARAACSFTPDTLVATPGGAVPISSVEVGDKVLAWDESTGHVVERAVSAVLPHPDDEITKVTIDGTVLTTTPDHPFYTIERGWVEAGQLWSGAHVQTPTGADPVTSARTSSYSGTLWDLSVAGGHTYFVGSGSWLVHNCAAPVKTPWGWSGSPSFRDQVRVVDAGGTIERVSGVIPTRADAELLIESAGGTVLRVEPGHLPPNPHTYPHINYTTSSGGRGTIQITGLE